MQLYVSIKLVSQTKDSRGGILLCQTFTEKNKKSKCVNKEDLTEMITRTE